MFELVPFKRDNYLIVLLERDNSKIVPLIELVKVLSHVYLGKLAKGSGECLGIYQQVLETITFKDNEQLSTADAKKPPIASEVVMS